MSGRGRGAPTGEGRGRGRGRGDAAAAAPAGDIQAAAPAGRGRGAPAATPESIAAGVQAVQITPTATAARPPAVQQAAAAPAEGRPMTRAEVAAKAAADMAPKPPHDADGEARLAPRQVTVNANYFAVATRQPTIYQYAVSFDPPLDSRSMRYAMVASHTALIGDVFAFDGVMLFLMKKLPEKLTYAKSTRAHDNQEFEITIQATKELAPRDCFQLYNIIFRKVLRLLKLKQIGRHYFNPARPAQIPQHNLELWPGYTAAIAEYESGTLLNIDVAHKVLRTDTVLDHLLNLKRRFNRSPQDFQDGASDYLIGQVVLTRYNNRTYHIDGIAWDLTPNSTFQLSTGEQISYADYYNKNYNKRISDLAQPLLIHKAKKKFKKGTTGTTQEETIYLVPELCCMTGFTDEVKKNFTIMKEMSAYTIISPADRRSRLEEFIKSVYGNPEIDAELKKWNMEFSRQLVTINARVFNPERILFGNKQVVSENADWGRDIKNVDLIQAIHLENWVVIYSAKMKGAADQFTGSIAQVARPFGIRVERPVDVALQRDGASDFVNAIREHYKPGQTQFVCCILPDDRKDRYDAVKKYCIADAGIVSQCILSKTMNNQKIVMSAITKIVMQINVKLGGQLWATEVPLKSCMIIGVDVYHDSVQKGTSVAGFVASMNQSFTKYYTRAVFQRTGQELLDGLKQCLSDALKKYFAVNKEMPNRIIVFRDGVGDGQMSHVLTHEVPQLRESFRAFGPDYNPKLAYIVVKKRINTRIMDARGQNPPPGTLVSTTITGKHTYDYFIVAQQVRQGTVTPTNYHVVFDTSGLKPSQLEALSFKLTHLYYNWPGTVRVPAPCQYAHKLAFIIGQSVHKDPHLQLADKLYYL